MSSPELERRLLSAIAENPDTTQAHLAAQLGVAVGSVNWYMKRLVHKGYVKVTHLQRRKLKYFLTPQGLAVKARLTSEYKEASLRLYRRLRRQARHAAGDVVNAGFQSVNLDGDGDAAEILRLTCLERGIRVSPSPRADIPTIAVEGLGFAVSWPEAAEEGPSAKAAARALEAQAEDRPETNRVTAHQAGRPELS